MGQCTSRDEGSPAQHGTLVLANMLDLSDQAPQQGANTHYHIRTCERRGSTHWYSFNAMGVLVEGDAGLDALLVSPSSKQQLFRLPFSQLLAGADVKNVAVAPIQPSLTPTECLCLTQFAAQAEQMMHPSRRVRILSSKGRKIFAAELVAEMLVAIGRHVKQGDDDVYRARSGCWSMPDITFMTLTKRRGSRSRKLQRLDSQQSWTPVDRPSDAHSSGSPTHQQAGPHGAADGPLFGHDFIPIPGRVSVSSSISSAKSPPSLTLCASLPVSHDAPSSSLWSSDAGLRMMVNAGPSQQSKTAVV